MNFSRTWAMPAADTFSISPIYGFVRKFLLNSKLSIDPFARNCRLATITNDINPNTAAQHHEDAEAFLVKMQREGRQFDLGIFDPPYSPRQISECYQEAGLKCEMKDTQNAALYSRARNAMAPLIKEYGVVLSFGWNSGGMGIGRGFEPIEILLVSHGAAHNDTICLAERKRSNAQTCLWGLPNP